MNIEDTLPAVGSVAAIGLLTYLVLQLIIKPLLNSLKITEEDQPDKRAVILNASALVIAWLVAALGAVILNTIGEPTQWAWIIQNGIYGAALAVFGYEFLTNARNLVGK